jgi:hypothetical protein
MVDLGILSTSAVIAAAEYLGEKAAGGAAFSAGSKLIDWLKEKLSGSVEQESLDRLASNPKSPGAIKSLDGALLSRLEQNPSFVSELETLLRETEHRAQTVQTVTGSGHTAVQLGGRNHTVTISNSTK